MNEQIKYIADHYGFRHQCVKAVEELNELSAKLAKSSIKNSLRFDVFEEIEEVRLRHDVIEEIADVEIMLAQIKYLSKISEDDIEDCKKYKLDRQINRIKEKENER